MFFSRMKRQNINYKTVTQTNFLNHQKIAQSLVGGWWTCNCSPEYLYCAVLYSELILCYCRVLPARTAVLICIIFTLWPWHLFCFGVRHKLEEVHAGTEASVTWHQVSGRWDVCEIMIQCFYLQQEKNLNVFINETWKSCFYGNSITREICCGSVSCDRNFDWREPVSVELIDLVSETEQTQEFLVERTKESVTSGPNRSFLQKTHWVFIKVRLQHKNSSIDKPCIDTVTSSSDCRCKWLLHTQILLLL